MMHLFFTSPGKRAWKNVLVCQLTQIIVIQYLIAVNEGGATNRDVFTHDNLFFQYIQMHGV